MDFCVHSTANENILDIVIISELIREAHQYLK